MAFVIIGLEFIFIIAIEFYFEIRSSEDKRKPMLAYIQKRISSVLLVFDWRALTGMTTG